MKSYKNLEELNKEWSPYGFRVNEKGEILGTVDGKEYKCGKIRLVGEEEINKIERERERERERAKT